MQDSELAPEPTSPRQATLATLGRRRVALTAISAVVALLGVWVPPCSAAAEPGKSPLTDAATSPSTRARSGGVGMVLDGRGGRVVVSRVVPGGPAALAGVRVNDVVIAVDGVAVAAGAVVSSIAAKVRGPVGRTVRLSLLRDGKPSDAVVTRGDLSRLFPQRAKVVLTVDAGLSLLATSGRWTLGVTFPRGGAMGELLRYQWVIAPVGRKLSDAKAQRGLGAVAWGKGGATIQVADWRLELKPWPGRGKLVVAQSNLPVASVEAAQWIEAEPMQVRYVRPRGAPRPYRATWPSGDCTINLRVTLDGAKAAHHRVTLRLADRSGVLKPSATVTTNAEGEASLQLASGDWRVQGLLPSLPGARRDLYYAAQVTTPVAVRCRATAPTALALEARSPALAWVRGGGPLPAASHQHALVGKPLPEVAVKRWLGGGNPLPKTLKGKVMLVYFWATWCGPCKRVSPMVAELATRLGQRGLLVVPTSVDRDVLALEDYVSLNGAGALPVAWVGPEPLARLPIRGIPTTVVIDDEGIVRAVHTGTGVGVETWERYLGELLDEAQGLRARRPPAALAPATKAKAAKAAAGAPRGSSATAKRRERRKARGKRPRRATR